MMFTQYTREVQRFGGPKPYVVEDKRYYLDQKTSVEADQVKTDGRGNVIERPLLRRKDCLGRPERFLRGVYEERRARVDPEGFLVTQETRCQRCPTLDACSKVALERIESCPTIEMAVVAWLDETEHLPAVLKHTRGRPGRRWRGVLNAIEAHGGWFDVNEGRVAAHEACRAAERDRQRRESSRRRRQRQRQRYSAHLGIARPSVTLHHATIEAAGDDRLRILRDLRGRRVAPRYITKLDLEGCQRTVDVWKIKHGLAAVGRPATGTAIAEIMALQYGLPGVTPALRTRAYRDLERISKLEKSHNGVAIWKPLS